MNGDTDELALLDVAKFMIVNGGLVSGVLLKDGVKHDQKFKRYMEIMSNLTTVYRLLDAETMKAFGVQVMFS